jgi:hypothetical protein
VERLGKQKQIMGDGAECLPHSDVSENGTALPPSRYFISITVGIIPKLRIAEQNYNRCLCRQLQ